MPKSRSTLPRTHSHSHSHSSSSSKIAAVTNLQFTQKDPLPPKIPDKPKKNGLAAEYPPRTTSPYPRQTHSRIGSRGRSKEHIVPPAVPVKRAATPTAPPKVDFTISGSADDESEWVSSESGAVTPNLEYDQEEDAAMEAHRLHDDAVGTPRADLPPQLARVETARPSETKIIPHIREAMGPPELPLTRVLPERANTDLPKETRSQAPSPPPAAQDVNKRYSLTRPPSTRSVTAKADLRRHPLIRGHSYGVHKPSVAPLTVSSDSAQAQISTSPTSVLSGRATTSPTHMVHASGSRSPMQSAESTASLSNQLRRASISSTRSVATVPVQSSVPIGRATYDRTRTLSILSTASSSAALSSLAHLPLASRPPTPPYATHFPTQKHHSNLETIHPLLPPPYLSAHLSVLADRSPLRESFDRIMSAKKDAKRGC